MQDLTGTVFQGYEFRERIGEGGFGVVYRAYQSSIGREVAVKIIVPHLANHPEFILRLEREAHLVARLEHPSITPLHDYWRDLNGAYLVMRLFRGGNLRKALEDGPFSLESAALLLDQIAAALHAAHRNNVIHRDLKPENILLDEDGNAYLADFGIAKDITQSPGSALQADNVIGSPDYLSPEQVRAEAVTPMTDIYALGIVLFEALTGRYPFPHVSQIERIYTHLNDPLPPITTLSPEIADDVNTVIQKATAKNPSRRYPDALAFAAAFREAAGLKHPQPGENVVERLTLREQEVLQRIVAGKSNQEIAQELYITLGTVKWYIKQIYAKLRVRSRVQAIVRARELHLITTGSVPPQTAAAADGTTSVTLPEPENPYKGLRAFQAADNRDFFGREALVEMLLKRMVEVAPDGARAGSPHGSVARFLAIIGPSGSGKSSLVNAGLIPALWRGSLPGSERWYVVEMLPGSRPLDELEVALTQIAANYTANLRDQLQRDQYGLLRVAQLILPNDGSELVLVIDQFEELFTLVEDESERAHFLNMLVMAVTDARSRVRVVMTLRADFYDRPLYYRQFGEMVRSRMVTVLPLTPEGLERAIVRPAGQAGVTFEPGLVASIIADVNYQPSALPLLQYALTELFEQRAGHVITHEAYAAIGGTVGALAKRADELYDSLDSGGQEAARQLFLRLVTLGDGVEDTRRRVPISELMAISASAEVMDDLIDTYTSYRLLTLDHDPATRAPTVEIAHEALIRSWTRLREWLDENREDLRLQRQLMTSAGEWDRAKRDTSFLAGGARLAQFESLPASSALALSDLERAYLRAAVVEDQRREREHQSRQRHMLSLQRGMIAILSISLLVTGALSIFAFSSRNDALAQARAALSRQLAAQAVAELQNPIGNDEYAALLAIRSLNTQYDEVADGALVQAAARLPLNVFTGHDDIIYAVAFSPDGSYVLTGSADHTARLWDAATGQQVRAFVGHGGEVYSVAFSPDGRYVLTGSEDATAKLWDVDSGQEITTFSGHTEVVYNAIFSPDGNTVLTTSDDGTARLWDLVTGEYIRDFDDGDRSVDFSPDDRLVLTSGEGYTITLREVTTGRLIHTLRGHRDWVYDAEFSPDGRYVLSGSLDNTAILWDAATGERIYTILGHSSSVRSVAFTPDGNFFLTASSDSTVRLWDVASGREVRAFRGHRGRVWSVAISPDGSTLLTGSADGTAKLWRIAPQHEAGILSEHSGEVYDVALSPDRQYALTGSADATARLWDVASAQQLRVFSGHGGTVHSAAFSPDGHYALTGSADATARLWDVTSGELLQTFTGHDEEIWGVAFSPDDRYIATASGDDTAILWDRVTGEAVHTFTDSNLEMLTVAFSPDSTHLLTASAYGTINLWTVENGEPLQTFYIDGSVYSAIFSPDGRSMLTGSDDQLVRLWDLATGQVIRTFRGHRNTVYNVAFSPDGNTVLSASADRTARIWNTATGEIVRVLRGHESAVWGVAYSPDGSRILTGSLDSTARLWQSNYREFVSAVCDRLLRDFTDEEREQIPLTSDEATCPN